MVRELLTSILLLYLFNECGGIIRSSSGSFLKPLRYPDPDHTINKVSLTQKGYIQFLRYITKVPPLTDYTFCIWIRSSNLTYNHPILSYSKHEEKRLIRVWISPLGESVNLEILNHPVFEVPINMVENHWYHICQSWSSQQAAWNLYFNGKLKSSGYAPKLRGVIIEGEGDIVVGQEYTDFDKGLDDGIEGDIFGFNFVLAPSNSIQLKPVSNYISRKHYNLPRRQLMPHHQVSPSYYSSKSPTDHEVPRKATQEDLEDTNQVSRVTTSDEVPDVLSYFNTPTNRDPKGLLDVFQNAFGLFDQEPTKIKVQVYQPPNRRISYGNTQKRSGPSRVFNDVGEARKPLGLVLVELSFDCGYRKGAPLSGKGVLINWTKSPVRVFGGAILKSVPPFCT